jgi:hypothetical protein
MSNTGYVQVIDNLVYHAIRKLQTTGTVDDEWQHMVDIINLCANTYQQNPQQVLSDYSNQLSQTLITLANVQTD